MKISQEEIDAATQEWFSGGISIRPNDAMRNALKAAYTVRRARKQAKRERQRKEKDKQVVGSVKPAEETVIFKWVPNFPSVPFMGVCPKCGNKRCPHHQNPVFECTGSNEPNQVGVVTPSKAPEWDGTFSPGEYEMRNGAKQVIRNIDNHPKWPLNGVAGRCYDVNGRYYGMTEQDSEFDLIRPWPKGEQ